MNDTIETTLALASASGQDANTAAIALKADKTITLTAGAGLTGGGTLAASRTFDVVAADGSITVNADSIQVTMAAAAPLAIGTAAVGTAVKAAREDHVHACTSTAVTNSSGVSGATVTAALDALATLITANTSSIALKADKSYTVNDQTGTTYTLVLADAGALVTLSNASAIALTIPANASVAYPIGTVVQVLQKGAGQITAAITSDTLNKPATFVTKSREQWSMITFTKIASTTWVASGDMAFI